MRAGKGIKICVSIQRIRPVKKAGKNIFLNMPIKCEVHPSDFILLR
jgi:hypothetical protein